MASCSIGTSQHDQGTSRGQVSIRAAGTQTSSPSAITSEQKQAQDSIEGNSNPVALNSCVKVFSNTASMWIDAKVVAFPGPHMVRVEYEVDEMLAGRTLHIKSDCLRFEDDLVGHDPESLDLFNSSYPEEPPRAPCKYCRCDTHIRELYQRDDMLTQRLLRDELKYFAGNLLQEELSKMRRLFQEDIEDALLRADARARCTSSSGDKLQHVTAPQKPQWAVARPTLPTMVENVRGKENSLTLQDVGDPLSKFSAEDIDSVKVMKNGASQRSTVPAEYSTENSRSTQASQGKGKRFLLKGHSFFETTKEVVKLRSGFTTSQTMRTSVDEWQRGSKEPVSSEEMQKELKRMKNQFRTSKERQGHKFKSTAQIVEKLGSGRQTQILRCLEIFLEHGIRAMIVLNGICIGAQTDYQARKLTENVPEIFTSMETIFCIVFVIELAVRVCVFKSQYFFGDGWRWNWFDAILVVFQIIEVGGMLVFSHESSSGTPVGNVGFLRLLRILRFLRVLRLLRMVEFIGELKTIIGSIANSMKALCWTLLLLLLMIYIVSIFFTQAVFSKRVTLKESDPASEELAKWWGSVDRSLLSLYQAILGGVDWDDPTLPLSEHISPGLTLLFCLYVAFVLLAVMNVITGIFAESALKNAEKEKDTEFTETAHAVFALSDVDNSGQITWDEFEAQLDEPCFHWYMKNFGIDPSDAKLLFKLLDHDNSGSLDLEEVLSGMTRLRAGAKFIDIMKVMHEIELTPARLQTILA